MVGPWRPKTATNKGIVKAALISDPQFFSFSVSITSCHGVLNG
jgi:hypothetical protein